MKTSDVTIDLIGRRVIDEIRQETGTIINVFENLHEKSILIKYDNPFICRFTCGDYTYTHYQPTARISDEFGNLRFFKLI